MKNAGRKLKIIGHRGARGLAPENTLEAIQKALEHGADEIEFDIRITHDGVAVLIHDDAIVRESDTFPISQHTYHKLKTVKADLTTLTEALDLIDTKAIPHIEVKHGEPVGPIVTVLKEYLGSGMYSPGDLLIGSKSQKTLHELHTALPDVPTVVIESWSGVRAAYRARQLGTKRISMRSWWLWRGFLASMQRRGYQITPYTMNDPLRVQKWQPYIYGVVTDYPDLFE